MRGMQRAPVTSSPNCCRSRSASWDLSIRHPDHAEQSRLLDREGRPLGALATDEPVTRNLWIVSLVPLIFGIAQIAGGLAITLLSALADGGALLSAGAGQSLAGAVGLATWVVIRLRSG